MRGDTGQPRSGSPRWTPKVTEEVVRWEGVKILTGTKLLGEMEISPGLKTAPRGD